jgi:peptidoglycan-N-acetylmuramic acid deacetylase
MRKHVFLACVMTLFLIGGAMAWFHRAEELKPSQQPQVPAASALSDEKEGWGFVKSENGEVPQITQHQWDLVNKYKAIFVGDRTKKRFT